MVKDYFLIIIPSLSLSIALYTLLANNKKFREFSKKLWSVVMLQLIAVLNCTGLLIINHFLNQATTQANQQASTQATQTTLSVIQSIGDVFTYIMFVSFLLSWIMLCKEFFLIYGSLYHLRKKRFLKYTKPVAWIYEKFFHKSFYETNYRSRDNFTFHSFIGVDGSKLQKLKNGGTILLLCDDSVDYSSVISSYIKETIHSSETVDFVSTYKAPVEICNTFKESDIPSITKHLSIIDCFSAHYAFDDKIIKYTMRNFEMLPFC